MVAAKKKPSDVKSWHFSAKTPRGTEYHLVFATSENAARAMLQDRYLGKHAIITSLKPKKPVKE